jgi:hypothetical protein
LLTRSLRHDDMDEGIEMSPLQTIRNRVRNKLTVGASDREMQDMEGHVTRICQGIILLAGDPEGAMLRTLGDAGTFAATDEFFAQLQSGFGEEITLFKAAMAHFAAHACAQGLDSATGMGLWEDLVRRELLEEGGEAIGEG